MTRDEFLKTHWTPYPPANPQWKAVADFLVVPQAFPTWVAGRIINLQRQSESCLCRLFSGGREIEVEIGSDGRFSPPVSVEVLSDGDLVCLEIASLGGDQKFLARDWILLAPNRATDAYVSRSKFDLARSAQWSEFISLVRKFFHAKGFIEALTPTLVPSPGTEPFLDPFVTQWQDGECSESFYLPTSPEFHLKKMLSLGWTRVFEIKTCFRNGERGENHQPEFQMLEWYRAYQTLDQIADDTEELVKLCSEQLLGQSVEFRRTTMSDLFANEFPGFRLTPHTSLSALQDLARRAAIHFGADDNWDDLFFRIFLERIEPQLGQGGPLLVRGYPPSQAALARIGADGFADRFEIYWRGLELANAFHELNDPSENEERFADDARRKSEIGKAAVPLDAELLHALRYGLPPSGGIALGLERLFMALFELNDIRNTRTFPF